MYYVYAIFSKAKNYIYVGISRDFKRRVNEHNSGKNKTTKLYRPFDLIFKEKHITRTDARKREKYLKSGVGNEFLKSLIR